jgi:hypothetical protein
MGRIVRRHDEIDEGAVQRPLGDEEPPFQIEYADDGSRLCLPATRRIAEIGVAPIGRKAVQRQCPADIDMIELDQPLRIDDGELMPLAVPLPSSR